VNRFIAWLTGLHQHRCRTESDETGIWGECIICHQRFGFVTRAELRRYADREIEKRTGLKP
jgi:hypothetical protein